MKKSKLIYTIIGSIFIFMVAVIVFRKDVKTPTVEDTKLPEEITDTVPKTTLDLVKKWYSDTYGLVNIPDVLYLDGSIYSVLIDKNEEGKSALLINKVDGENESSIYNFEFESTAKFSIKDSYLIDKKFIFFNIILEKDFDCSSTNDKEKCIKDAEKFLGIWMYDFETKKVESVFRFSFVE